MSTPLMSMKLVNRMTVEQCLSRMSKSLVKSVFNAVVVAADVNGWGALNAADDVFGKRAVEDEVPEFDDGFKEEFMEHVSSDAQDL